MSTALLTDQYELTMLESALASGTYQRKSVFQVYARRLPNGRRYGVFAGVGRLLEHIENFRFTDRELNWLESQKIVGPKALELLANYKFNGTISGYQEGEVFFPHSPVLTVEGTFWEAVLLETLVLSVLNHDTAVASAASRMVSAAGGRSLAEMGSRRAAEWSAVAAARAAYIAGFSATSNLEAGIRWGVPTMGTAAHAFTLLHDSEAEAFQAQLNSLGKKTTLLVDTYDIEKGVDLAVKLAGTELGAVRIDSGDLPVVVREVRKQLDKLGATNTKITVTNDLDEYAIAALAAAPVDSYGVGTSVVTGSGFPTAGMVYKLVAREDSSGTMIPVAKKSAAKSDPAGHKLAYRQLNSAGVAEAELIYALHAGQSVEELEAEAKQSAATEGNTLRKLQLNYIDSGVVNNKFTGAEGTTLAKAQNRLATSELSPEAFRLAKGEPCVEVISL